MTDAFGGRGGIAKYNRDLLTALCGYPACSEVVAIPRIICEEFPCLPKKLTYVAWAANQKIKYVLAMLWAVVTVRFDLILCGHIHLIPLAVILKRLLRVPLVLVIHGVDAWEPTGRALVERGLPEVDWVIAVSQYTKKRFVDWANFNADSIFILPNCFDPRRLTPGQVSPTFAGGFELEGKKVLLTLARLSSLDRYKGIDEVLNVFADLLDKIPNLSYLIAGEGDDKVRLEAKVRSLGLDTKVFFTGYIPDGQKADYYRLADLFVMPGWGEGFGIVYLEALACGIPVVASKLDAGQEVVGNFEMAVTVDPRDPQDLKSGILKALNFPKGARPKGLEVYSYEAFEGRVHHLLDSFTTRSGGVR